MLAAVVMPGSCSAAIVLGSSRVAESLEAGTLARWGIVASGRRWLECLQATVGG